MKRLTGVTVFLLGGGFVAGCADDGAYKEDYEAVSSALVSSSLAVTPFGSTDGASETTTLVNQSGGTARKIVAFNYNDSAHITFTPTTRRTCSGASMMGWAWASPGTADPFTVQRVPAPVAGGFPIVWGDPALGQIEGTGNVYLANLAVPAHKMPSSGCIDNALNSYLGGACIARSTNGGQTFTLNAADCVHSAAYNFYDGAAMAGSAAFRNMYAAFMDVDNHKVDLWYAKQPNAPFVQLANPFPGKQLCGHPRMTADNVNGNVYIVAPDCGTGLWLQYVSGTTLGSAASNWPISVANDFAAPSVTIAGLEIRRGSTQFDLAVEPYVNAERVAVLYSAWNANHATLKEVSCRIFAGSSNLCTPRGTIDPGVNVFHPSIAAASIRRPGLPVQGVFQAAWTQQFTTSTVKIMSGLLKGPSGGTGAIAGRSETGATQVCPDLRGYWGDYNNHLGVHQATPSDNPRFWTAFTDSTDAFGGFPPCTRSEFTASPVNVTATWISFP